MIFYRKRKPTTAFVSGRLKIRGLGLGAVLVTSLVLFVLLTVLVGANFSTLSVVRHSEGAHVARGAAESLTARAVYELRQDTDYQGPAGHLEFKPLGSDSGQASLTFEQDTSKAMGIPLSVNNLDNTESVAGPDGQVIPARTARLIAAGTYGSEIRTVITDLHIPPYPYAIATDGTFESLGDLTVTGLSFEGDEIPGHVLTNASSKKALTLGPHSLVSGDLLSAGGIVLAPDNVEVKGEIRPNSKPSEVPRIVLSDLDPRSLSAPGAVTDLRTSFYKNPNMEGKVLRDGDLALKGKIRLDGALLFVDGDLEINGHLEGRGAIVVTGALTISGTQSLTTDNELALLTGGDLSVYGHGVESSKLAGLIYAEGDVEVRNSTIQGTLIGRSNGGTSPSIVVEKAHFIHDPARATFRVTLTSKKSDNAAPGYLAFEESTGRYLPDENTTDPPIGTVNRVFIGVGQDKNGGYLIFPPDGSPILEVGDKASDAAEKLEDFVTLSDDVDEQIEADLANVARGIIEGGTSGGSGSSSYLESDLEIDPMKFLKYGEQIRIRSTRVVETSTAGSKF